MIIFLLFNWFHSSNIPSRHKLLTGKEIVEVVFKHRFSDCIAETVVFFFLCLKNIFLKIKIFIFVLN
jgi:hypothetical protein